MKQNKLIFKLYVLILVLVLAFQITGCSILNSENVYKANDKEETSEQYEEDIKEYQEEIAKLKEENDELSSEIETLNKNYEEKIKQLEESPSKAEENALKKAEGIIVIPEYTGSASVVINDGIPFFSDEDLKTTGELYSDLDAKGRCGVCIALVGPETVPSEPRGSIGDIKPSGWDTIKYDGIDGNYLYNRCHLIGWQLTGENDNTKNLITGTRYMNTQGMEPIESTVANYVQTTGNHVLYRSTPVFTGDNLLAAGVLLEALSIEDDTIRINSFCYNVQPNVTIDYATGKSEGPVFTGTETEATVESGVVKSQDDASSEEASNEESENEVVAKENSESSEEEKVVTYVGNANSHKFHKPGCSSVGDMAEHNKVFFYGDRQEVVDKGYQPCKRCNP